MASEIVFGDRISLRPNMIKQIPDEHRLAYIRFGERWFIHLPDFRVYTAWRLLSGRDRWVEVVEALPDLERACFPEPNLTYLPCGTLAKRSYLGWPATLRRTCKPFIKRHRFGLVNFWLVDLQKLRDHIEANCYWGKQ
jgi:hypothetical protein